MAKTNRAMADAKRSKSDEFYTQLDDIEKELAYYTDHFKGKTVFCNCDDPFESNFFKYFALNFNRLGLKKLIATCYSGSPIVGTQFSLFNENEDAKRTPYKAVVTTVHDATGDGGVNMLDIAELFRNGENHLTRLEGDGDFRSKECISLLEESDIVVTNPPFSLFREFLAQLIKYDKKFLIIGNSTAITYKEIFPLLKNNKMWLGVTRHGTGSMWFRVTDTSPVKTGQKIENGVKYQTIGNSAWFTNLEHRLRHEILPLYKRYSKDEYPQYDNFNAIEVGKTVDIPFDYPGVMGVPISFFGKYCAEQFEIVGISSELAMPVFIDGKKKTGRFYLKNKRMFDRIAIRLKRPEE